MTLRYLGSSVVIAVLCCGGRLGADFAVATPVSAPDVFTCVADKAKAMEYAVESRDVADRRLVVRKYDTKSRRPDVQFRRLIDRLEIEVGSGGANGMTTLNIAARSYAEYTRHRGPTEEEERASSRVKEDAEALLQRCGQPS